jgi:hypothetical protein
LFKLKQYYDEKYENRNGEQAEGAEKYVRRKWKATSSASKVHTKLVKQEAATRE